MNTCKKHNTFTRTYSKGKSFIFSEWSPTFTYSNDDFKQDFVTYKGNLYACITSNTNKIPSNSNSWLLVIEKLPTITFIPEIDKDGNLLWRERVGNEFPEPTNIKGPKGDKGDKGDKGEKGDTGAPGLKGEKGDSGNGNLEVGDGPLPTIANKNDIYLNLKTGTFYKWTTGWESIGKISTSTSGGSYDPTQFQLEWQDE